MNVKQNEKSWKLVPITKKANVLTKADKPDSERTWIFIKDKMQKLILQT